MPVATCEIASCTKPAAISIRIKWKGRAVPIRYFCQEHGEETAEEGLDNVLHHGAVRVEVSKV